MASNQAVNYLNRLSPGDLQYGGNALAPYTQFDQYGLPQQAAPLTVDTTGGTVQTGLPAWLTDLSARGIGNSFAPTQGQVQSPLTFTPRDIPVDVPQPQQFSAQQGGAAGLAPGAIDPLSTQAQYNRAEGPDVGGAGNGNDVAQASQDQSAANGGGNGSGSSGPGGIGLDLSAFGDRLPSTASLDLSDPAKAAFGLGTMAMGPVGTAFGALNTIGNTVNTGLNTAALGQMGVNVSGLGMLGGALGFNGYGGTLASAMNQAMDTAQGRGAIGSAQNNGPTSADIAQANIDHPTDPMAGVGAVDPQGNPGTAVDQQSLDAPSGPAADPSAADGPAGPDTSGGMDGSGGGGGPDGPNGPDSGGGNEGGGGGGNSKGGVITPNKLIADPGVMPARGDNGLASIQTGEGVLTRKAMQYYGPAFLAQLNKLAVPKGALRR